MAISRRTFSSAEAAGDWQAAGAIHPPHVVGANHGLVVESSGSVGLPSHRVQSMPGAAIFSSETASFRKPDADATEDSASSSDLLPALVMQNPKPHMIAQGARAISSGAIPAATSQGQPNQSAGTDSTTAAAISPRRPRSW